MFCVPPVSGVPRMTLICSGESGVFGLKKRGGDKKTGRRRVLHYSTAILIM